MKILINNEEVLCDKNIVIEEEMLNTPSVILNNVFPKAWENDKDYVSNFYYPPDYSKCLIIEDEIYRLPSEYKEVDYIESTGTQYIDLGIDASRNTKAELEIKDIPITNSKIFGSRTSANVNDFSISTEVINSTPNLVCNFPSNMTGTFTTDITTAYENVLNISLNKSYITIENKTTGENTRKKIFQPSTFTTPGNLYLFSASGTFTGYSNASMKLYYCKVWNGNTLIRDLVPCYRVSDNEVGLYDLANDVFYTNEGTGTFSYGSVVPASQNLLFCGMVRNTGEISLNPRYPHYCSVQVLDFKDFLSQGETLDFVLTDMPVKEAILRVISTIADYGFVVGNIDIIGASDVIGAYSTLEKTAYDVFNYLADITQSKWTTRMIDADTVAIDFYDPSLMPEGTTINYTTQFFEDYEINDMSFSYSTNDYRNKQVMTSDEVYGAIQQSQTLVANGYQIEYLVEQKIGQIEKITVNGVKKTFITKDEKDLGQVADFYYAVGETSFESDSTLSAGQIIVISYTPIIKGRQTITNSTEIDRVATATGRKGVVARYENRSDATTSNELQKIGQAYIQYKGTPEILLTIESTKNTWNIGEIVQFNAPLDELDTTYLVKKKTIHIISTVDTIFYTYEMSSNFNTENAINYFDNQRAKNNGNIGTGEYIDRNIDLENTANVIFENRTITEVVPVGDNELNCTLDAPFIV